MPGGVLKRLEVIATTAADARQLTFAECPRAVSVSCRADGRHSEERRHD
jgi:hypothetical protein